MVGRVQIRRSIIRTLYFVQSQINLYIRNLLVMSYLIITFFLFDIHDFDLGLYGQLGVGTNRKQTLPMFVEALKNEKIYLICCGSFETVSKSFIK